MILGFKEQLDGLPTYFEGAILNGLNSVDFGADLNAQIQHYFYLFDWSQFPKPPRVKLHTIREDKHDRWKPGRMIDFFVNIRRPRLARRIAPRIPCTLTQDILITSFKRIFIDGRELSQQEIEALAINDGFADPDQFWKWFGGEEFHGKIIHWYNTRY